MVSEKEILDIHFNITMDQTEFDTLDTQIQGVKKEREPIIESLIAKAKELRNQIHWIPPILYQLKTEQFLMNCSQLNIEERFVSHWAKERNELLYLSEAEWILIDDRTIRTYDRDGRHKELLSWGKFQFDRIVELIRDFFLESSVLITQVLEEQYKKTAKYYQTLL